MKLSVVSIRVHRVLTNLRPWYRVGITLGAHLSWELDDPGGRHDDAREHTEAALLLDLLHHEARRLVVVSALAVRARDRHDLLHSTEDAAHYTESLA